MWIVDIKDVDIEGLGTYDAATSLWPARLKCGALLRTPFLVLQGPEVYLADEGGSKGCPTSCLVPPKDCPVRLVKKEGE